MAKKAFGFNPSITDLDFGHATAPALSPNAVGALAAINRYAPVTVSHLSASGNVFRLKSNELSDTDLFNTLKRTWPWVSGRNILNCCVIYCENGPERGVWLRHLSNASDLRKYTPGCHRIAWWS